MGPLLAALIVIPFGQASIGWFALAALLAIFILIKIGNWYKRRLAVAARKTVATAATPAHGLTKRKNPGRAHYPGRIGIFEIFLHRLYDQLFHVLLMDKFSMSVQGAQYCLFRISGGFGGRNILRRGRWATASDGNT